MELSLILLPNLLEMAIVVGMFLRFKWKNYLKSARSGQHGTRITNKTYSCNLGDPGEIKDAMLEKLDRAVSGVPME